MTASEIQSTIEEHFGNKPGYDAEKARAFAQDLSSHIASVNVHANLLAASKPTPAQQQCYDKCKSTRDAALVLCATKGFPLGLACAAAAITAFNACRANCDH